MLPLLIMSKITVDLFGLADFFSTQMQTEHSQVETGFSIHKRTQNEKQVECPGKKIQKRSRKRKTNGHGGDWQLAI